MKSIFIRTISKTVNFVLDLLFPKYCVGCGVEGVWICDKCKKEIILIQKPTCPKCNQLVKRGKFCKRCRPNSNLTGVHVAAYYNEGPLKEAIHNFKYNYISDLKYDLGQILITTLKSYFLKSSILIPVPLHKKRKAERGYNQSQLLALEISERLHLQIIDNKLVRNIFTTPQVKLSGRERKNNIKNAFVWKGKDEIRGKNVILVDDVYTTGATLQECAKILRNSGARQIWGLVLAKV